MIAASPSHSVRVRGTAILLQETLGRRLSALHVSVAVAVSVRARDEGAWGWLPKRDGKKTETLMEDTIPRLEAPSEPFA